MGFNKKISGGKEYCCFKYDRELPQPKKNIDTSDPTLEEFGAYVANLQNLHKESKEKKLAKVAFEGCSFAMLLLLCLEALIPYFFWNKLLILFFPSLFHIPLLAFVILLSVKRYIKATSCLKIEEK